MTAWNAWSGLSSSDGGRRFRVERPSEAADWYTIVDADLPELRSLIDVADDVSIEAAWERWITEAPSLDALRAAGIEVRPRGTWIPDGDLGRWTYAEGAADAE